MLSRSRTAFIRIVGCLVFAIASAATFSTCTPSALAHPARPTARNGVLDLTGWDFQSSGPLSLAGRWDFYWSRTADRLGVEAARKVVVPGSWTRAAVIATKTNGTTDSILPSPRGYGTYVLAVRHAPTSARLSIAIETSEAAQVYVVADHAGSSGSISRSIVLTNGVFGRSQETVIPHFGLVYGTFVPPSSNFKVLIQIANYRAELSGGIYVAPRLGTEKQIQSYYQWIFFLEILFSAAPLIAWVYYFVRFLIRRSDTASLFFSLLCLDRLLTTFVGQSWFGFSVFSRPTKFSFEAGIRIDSLAALLPSLFVSFTAAVFKGVLPRWSIRALWAVSLPIFFIWAVFADAHLLEILVEGYSVFVVAIGVYFTVLIVRDRETDSIQKAIFAFGVAVILFSVMLEVFTPEPAQRTIITSFAVFCFIIVQSTLLARNHEESIRYIEVVNRSLYRFVPQQFISQLGKKSIVDVEPGDSMSKEITVMFSDIRSFTTLAESMSPQECFRFLNEYFERIGPKVRSSMGYIDKFMGDGVMALFPVTPSHAFTCGVSMLEEVNRYNSERRSRGLDSFQIGIGIHIGNLVLGTVGDAERIDGTVISDVVNVASRLEGLNKTFGSCFLVSHEVRDRLSAEDQDRCRWLGLAYAKGRQKPVEVYEVMVAGATEAVEGKQESKGTFEEAVRVFLSGRFPEAHGLFLGLSRRYPGDGAVHYYVRRCEESARADWHE